MSPVKKFTLVHSVSLHSIYRNICIQKRPERKTGKHRKMFKLGNFASHAPDSLNYFAISL